MKIKDRRIWKYYKCGMISLIFIPVLFYIELKTNKVFAPQYGIENRYLFMPDSSARVNGYFFDYYSDYSDIKKRDTIRVLQNVDISKIDNLFDLKSGNSLCFSFSDSASYGDYISIYNCALKHKLAIFNVNNSSLVVFNPINNTIRITPQVDMFEWNLEGDLLPEGTLWIFFKNIVRYYYKSFVDYIDLLIKIDLFYKVFAICLGYLMIVILNMIEIKRMFTRYHIKPRSLE